MSDIDDDDVDDGADEWLYVEDAWDEAVCHPTVLQHLP